MRRTRQLALIGLVAACGVLASCGEPAKTLPRVDPAAGHGDPSIAVPIAVRTVAHPLSELLNLTHRLEADSASWAARGITFSSFGPDIVQDVVVLHLQNYSPASAAELEKAYGPLLLVATESQTASAA